MNERPSPEYLRDHCGQKPGVTSGFPFGEEHLVFKVRGKIFVVLHAEESPAKVTFKADPELTGLLRGQYPSVRPARYFDKRYWSTLACDGTVPEDEATELIDASYDIVVESLNKSDREALRGVR
ncbi:MmcQ/YjbR family DNA-binding protein [Rubrobacter tropicus]|uniref:MmcQ/YjbR family DNA-binding protein n=1 Tax=Rubrobacter tropicus TaxID=2653851 RepID=A0A6G8QCP0_9ACTN|nr:MmcQ/YjbR family DNA-binding protein [Rubrobacter tropicus]QIN84249.1 MmcQ/YjbR family DNA-binding protein [Rubrobacter tropicus]